MGATSSSTALILAGAVAKGAFEAGVLSTLAEAKIKIAKVVGASAGAMNAAVYAAGIRVGQEQPAASRLEQLWRDDADWNDVFEFSPSDVFSGRGFSTTDKIRKQLKEARSALSPKRLFPIELRVVVTALRGAVGSIGDEKATTFEKPIRFGAKDFDSDDGWNAICEAAVASASFPIAFTPTNVGEVGPCLDGGIVNNTPIKWALEGGDDIDRIIVVSPGPQEVRAPEPIEGGNLVGHFIDILVNERLYRDLHDAASVNEKLGRLDQLVRDGRLTLSGRDAIERAFGWRPLQIVPIRPREALPGNPFSGFRDRALRERYIEEGRKAAERALARL